MYVSRIDFKRMVEGVRGGSIFTAALPLSYSPYGRTGRIRTYDSLFPLKYPTSWLLPFGAGVLDSHQAPSGAPKVVLITPRMVSSHSVV